MLPITNCTSTYNTTRKANRKINFIVVHYTAGVSSKSGNALSIAKYFGSTPNEASADFIVDDSTIVQYNPDLKNYYCWSVGGSKYSSSQMRTTEGGKFYNICYNNNSVSIEMCSNKRNTSSLSVDDDDWYLTDATVNNTVELVKYLMNLYGIDADHVIMHHHVTGKICPQPWVKNQSALSGWYNFKAKLSGTSTPVTPTPAPTTNNTVSPAVLPDNIILKNGSSNSYVKTLQADLNKIIGANLAVDGIFGNGTRNAVITFQKKYGLSADGIVGKNTITTINNILNGKNPTVSNNAKIPTTILLKRGIRGDYVKLLQRYLNTIMGTNIAVDGIFGNDTENLVRKFQSKYGLSADGIAGKNTLTKINSLI